MWLSLVTTALAADASLLFVGNSYVDRNDLPGLVSEVLEEGAPGWEEVEARRLTGGGWTLSLHASELGNGPNGHTDALEDGTTNFDVVVLQEQSQPAGFDQAGGTWLGSLEAAGSLDEAIALHGAETLFYLTWGRRDGDRQNPERYPDFPTMQDHLLEGYLAYAAALSTAERPVFIAPAGLGFRAIWEAEAEPSDPSSRFYRLYANDGSHPSRLGSMLVAHVFFAALTGRSPVGLTTNPDGAIDAEDLDAIAAAAADVVLTTPFGEMRFPYALSWTEYAGTSAEVVLGGGAVRYQIRVEEDAGPVDLTLGESVLHLQGALELSTLTVVDDDVEWVLDGGSVVLTSAEPMTVELASLTGAGAIDFTGVGSWPEEAFPATVLRASQLDAPTLQVGVPEGFSATLGDGEIVVSRTGEDPTGDASGEGSGVGASGGCGCAHEGGGGVWLPILIAMGWMRRRHSRLSISPTSPATT